MPRDQNGQSMQTLAWTAGATIKVDSGASSAQSTAVAATGVYWLGATKDCYVERGTNPTASTSTFFLPAGLYPFPLTAGDKIAAIQSTEVGQVSITPAE
jgi:hypothetical protein